MFKLIKTSSVNVAIEFVIVLVKRNRNEGGDFQE